MKTIWIVLISVVATAVIVGSGVYYCLGKKASTDKNEMQTQIDSLNAKITSNEKTLTDSQAIVTPSVTPTPTPIPTAQPTAAQSVPSGWKAYTNTLYGYGIQYPSDWTTKDMHTTFGAVDTFGFEPPNTSANWIVTVSVYNTDPSLTSQDGTSGISQTTFAGKSATKDTFDNGYKYKVQASNGKYYTVTFEYTESTDSQSVRSTAEQIVQTFSFTN